VIDFVDLFSSILNNFRFVLMWDVRRK